MIAQLGEIKYLINILCNFAVYRPKISYVNELKTRLIDEWAQFDQLIVDAAISQWRRRLNACVCVGGGTLRAQILTILKRTVIRNKFC